MRIKQPLGGNLWLGGSMFIFNVKDMEACDSAVAIVKSVLHVDEEATVFVSMARHGVEITTESAGAAQMSDAITDAGFTPVLLPSGRTLPGSAKTPQCIPFNGADHDFSAGLQRDASRIDEW